VQTRASSVVSPKLAFLKTLSKFTDNLRRIAEKLHLLIMLPAFAALLLIVLWASIIHQVSKERVIALHETLARSQAMVNTFGEYSAQLLHQVNYTSQILKLEFENKNGKLLLADFLRKDGAMNNALPADIDLQIFIFDKQGNVSQSTEPSASINMANAQSFKDHSERPSDVLTINKIIKNTFKGQRWLIQFTRRLNNQDGTFAGVLLIEINPAFFVDSFDISDLGTQGVVVLLSPAEKLNVLRLGEQVHFYPELEFSELPQADSGERIHQMVQNRPFDAISRLFAARLIVEFDLTAVVGLTEDAALDKFHQRQWAYYAIATVITLLIAAFTALLMHQSYQVRQNIKETQDNHNFLKSLIDYLPVLVYVKSLRPADFGKIVVWNKTAEIVTGYSEQNMVGKNSHQAFPPEISEKHDKQDREMRDNPMAINIPAELLQRPDGTVRYLHTISVPLFDRKEQPEYILSIAEDITFRREQEHELRKKQAELRAVIDASPLGVIGADSTGYCIYVNRTFEEISGVSRNQSLGEGWMDSISKEDRDRLLKGVTALTHTNKTYQGIFRFTHGDGKIVWASLKIAAILMNEKIEGYVGSLDDTTVRREAELALQESEARLLTIANTLPAMIAYLDADQRFRFYNKSYEKHFKKGDEPLYGKTAREVVGEQRYLAIAPQIQRALAGETVLYQEDIWIDDKYHCFEVNLIPQFSQENTHVVGYHVMRQDMTDKKIEKNQLLYLSQADALTGLNNRTGFQLRLSEAMRHSQETGSLMALMFLDIDHFKPVNDTWGHKAGDELLKAFSSRLIHVFRSTDTISRLGGDEFTVILNQISDPEDAITLAKKLVLAMQTEFHLDRLLVSISTSVGVAYYQGGPETSELLLHQADLMLYEAKRDGRNTFKVSPLSPPSQ
jgi:diguanylate cyclase (GGDEF)-like protein/PAS domain S-box-containing protein